MTNKLWQCSLQVERGTYEQMPADWLGAVVSFYVGALTQDDALTKAVRIAQHMGMNYHEYASWFPSQVQVLEIVREGLAFHGPFAGWDRPERRDAIVQQAVGADRHAASRVCRKRAILLCTDGALRV